METVPDNLFCAPGGVVYSHLSLAAVSGLRRFQKERDLDKMPTRYSFVLGF
jgi:hypothetical protein